MLPLLYTDLPNTSILISNASLRPDGLRSDVLHITIAIDPGNGQGWTIQKKLADVLALDAKIREGLGKYGARLIPSLPDGRIWKDRAPVRVDERKALLVTYFTGMILANLPIHLKRTLIHFLTTDVPHQTKQERPGEKTGYLMKRGKNFGGWKSRYFRIEGPVLEYYDQRGGAHLGSILITGAQIGRQQRTEKLPTAENKAYQHAFLIIEAKKRAGDMQLRHVLCADSDEERDKWVEILVRYVSGSFDDTALPSDGQPQPAS